MHLSIHESMLDGTVEVRYINGVLMYKFYVAETISFGENYDTGVCVVTVING